MQFGLDDGRGDAAKSSVEVADPMQVADIARIYARASEVSGLVDLLHATEWKPDFDETAQAMVGAAAELAGADVTTLFILDDEHDRFDRYVQRYAEPEDVEWNSGELRVGVGRTLNLIATGTPNIIDTDAPNELDLALPDEVREVYKSMISIPLAGSGDVRGILSLVWKRKVDWQPELVDSLMLVGKVIGATIERQQRLRKAIELSVIGERRRLSAELHDNLAQLVTAIKFEAEMCQIAHENDDRGQVEQHLDRIVAVGKDTLKALREEMLSLRIPAEHTADLATAVEQMVEHMSASWDADIRLTLDGARPLCTTLETELQVVRILHEALSNVVRHSGAREADVSLSWIPSRMELAVVDHGKGFDPASVPAQRLGIRVMNERARIIDGSLSVTSAPGEGTSVTLGLALRKRQVRL